MKRILYSLLAVFVSGVTLLAQQRPPALSSPDVHPDHSITFRYFSRNAKKVMVSGEFLAAPVAMTKDTSGIWSVTVPPVKPDIYPYSFMVDSVSLAETAVRSFAGRYRTSSSLK